MKAHLKFMFFTIVLLCFTASSFIHADTDNQKDIYVAGFEYDDGNSLVAKYWRNGKAVSLSDGHYNAAALDIYIFGSDIYISGYEETESRSRLEAKFWIIDNKNTVKSFPLDHGKMDSYASALDVSGDFVHIAGYENDGVTGTIYYWKINKNVRNKITAIPLTTGTTSCKAYALCKSGNDVYVAGYESDKVYSGDGSAKIWKIDSKGNITSIKLTYGITVNSLFTFKNEIYAVGAEEKDNQKVAKLWKIDAKGAVTSVFIAEGVFPSEALSVFVTDSNVYIAGIEMEWDINVAKCWQIDTKGSITAYSLSDGVFDAYANSLVVSGANIYIAGWDTNERIGRAKYWQIDSKGMITTVPLTDEKRHSVANALFVMQKQ